MTKDPPIRRGWASVVVGCVIAAALVFVAPPTAHAAVAVDKASLSAAGSMSIEGRGAIANATITVASPESTASGRADSRGRFKFSATGYRSSTCRATVGDGSTSTSVTFSGCTPSSTPPPPPSTNQITPDVAELGPGYVGSDFTSFSTTTTTLTFGPDTLGPVRWRIVAGALPAGLTLTDPNAGFTPAKSIHVSITGTPTTVQTSTFTISATDANGLQASRSYTIRINASRTLDIVPQPWAPLQVGEFSNLWIDGVGGVRPYTWTRSAGAFPTGMSMIQDNPDGPLVRISGTPTTAGTSTFTVRLTDAQGATVSRSLTATVSAADTSPPPAAPTLLAPDDAATVTTPFTIRWSAELDPTSLNGGYNWQVSSSSTFSTLALVDSMRPDTTQATVSGLANGTWFWRVQAVDAQGRSSSFSAPRSFSISGTTTAQPGTSVLSLPPYGSSFHPFESFGFTWTAAERAVEYEFVATKDSSFASGLIKIDNIEQTSTGLQIGDFCGGCSQGTYFARVVAIDASGNRGLPSNTVSFTISYGAPVPAAPLLLNPPNGATVSLPFTLDWSDVPNPQSSGYEVQISRNSSFTDIEDPLPGRTASELQVLTLTAGTKFWRVRSHHGMASETVTAVTAWSATRTFTVPESSPTVQSVWLGAPPCQDPCPGADTLSSGQEINGSVQLAFPAPAGGAVVTLTSDPASAASHPASVTIPEGQAFAGFRLFAGDVTAVTPVTLTAAVGSSSDVFEFTVHPTTVQRLSFCCDSTGGVPAEAHLTFTGRVPSGGLTVTFSSSSPLADPPDTVTVPAGSFSAPISIPTSEVLERTTMTISATLGGTTVSAPLTLHPQQPPTSLVLDRAETNGTNGATGTVRIAASQGHSVHVRLTSSHPGIAAPPAYATIGSFGVAASFNVATQPPATSTEVTISAHGAGVTLTTTLVVHPVGGPGGGPSVSSLTLDPTTVAGGSASTATVALSAAAPAGGAPVTLTSGNTAAATVPASVTVPAGSTSTTFSVASRAVATTTQVQITGVYGGVARGAVLTVSPAPAPAPAVSALSVAPSTVTSGTGATGTVTLTSAAPAGGTPVALSSSDTAAATVPSSVTVAAGSTTATFTVTSRTVTTRATATISATAGGATRSAVLAVDPASSTVDTVAVQRAEYDSGGRVLRIEATSTSATATLQAFVTSTGTLIGTLSNDGGGRYRGALSVATNPQNVTVRSSLGGSASRSVVLK